MSEQAPEQPVSVVNLVPEGLAPFFDNPEQIRALAVDRSGASQSIMGYYIEQPVHERQASLMSLLGLSYRDTEGWGQDERDAVLTAARGILYADHDEMDRMEVVTAYTRTVRRLDQEQDYFGAPHSLYEMGQVLAAGFGEESNRAVSYQARMMVRDAWNDYFRRATNGPETHQAENLTETLAGALLPPPRDARPNWQYSRPAPPMRPATWELNQSYLREVRAQYSFKRYLYDNTPAFRAEAEQKGVDLAKFWNLADPDAMVGGVNALVTDERLGRYRARIDEALSVFKLSVDEIIEKPELGRIYADQIYDCITRLQADLLSSMHDPQSLYQMMRRQTAEALHARNPKKKVAPIRKMLEQLELDVSLPVDQLSTYLDSPDAKMIIEQRLDNRSLAIKADVQQLQHLFPDHGYRNLKLMARNEDDLYNADGTRDCTAYHLDNGFNAWTMPHWLANPGFQFAYVSMGKRPAAY